LRRARTPLRTWCDGLGSGRSLGSRRVPRTARTAYGSG
jgi:hypothetical protein